MQVVVPHVNCEMLFVCQKQLLQTQYVQHVQKSENTHIVNNIYKPSINIHGETENLQVLNKCVTSMQIVKLKKKIAVQCSEEKGKSKKVPLFFALCPRALCSRIRTRYFNLTCPSLRWVITGFTRRTLIIILLINLKRKNETCWCTFSCRLCCCLHYPCCTCCKIIHCSF